MSLIQHGVQDLIGEKIIRTAGKKAFQKGELAGFDPLEIFLPEARIKKAIAEHGFESVEVGGEDRSGQHGNILVHGQLDPGSQRKQPGGDLSRIGRPASTPRPACSRRDDTIPPGPADRSPIRR